ncbi:MAG TPA: endolytic transglycosylase MltG [Polyangiaceae bacterium]
MRAAIAVTATLIGALATSGLALSAWSYWSRSPAATPREVNIDPRASLSDVAEQLAQADLVDSSWLMSIYLATLGRFGSVVPGPHWFLGNASPRTLARCLARDARRPKGELLIPEGFDHVRVARRLEQSGICAANRFIAAVRQRDVLERLGIRGRDGEGYLFPATYRLELDSDPIALFERFASQTRERLRRVAAQIGSEPFESLAASRGWGESEILTLASLIEREAQRAEERPVIASVFFNRLDDETFRPRKMLQSDPTAAYGCLVLRDSIPSCREYEQRVLPAMLRDPSNPYNTYKHAGLPPGPIASPGESAIIAVLKPAVTPYLFFVASGDGRHRFSATFEDHDAKVRGAIP